MKKTTITCDRCGNEIPEFTKHWRLECNQFGAPSNTQMKFLDLCSTCFDCIQVIPRLAAPQDKEKVKNE